MVGDLDLVRSVSQIPRGLVAILDIERQAPCVSSEIFRRIHQAMHDDVHESPDIVLTLFILSFDEGAEILPLLASHPPNVSDEFFSELLIGCH
jgi:hypothetical protein